MSNRYHVEAMNDARVPLIDMGVRLLIQTLADTFTARRKRRASTLPLDTPSCKTCTIHNNVGMAYLHIKNMARLVDDNEPVPPDILHMTGLVREYITRAQQDIPDLMLDNDLYVTATGLGRDLVDVEKGLINLRTGKDIKALLDKTDEAVSKAYDIPEIIHGSTRALRNEIDIIRRRLEDASGRDGGKEATGEDERPGQESSGDRDPGEHGAVAQSIGLGGGDQAS